MRVSRERRSRASAERPDRMNARYAELKRMLIERRLEIQGRVQDGFHDARAERAGYDDAVLDTGETSAVNTQQDLVFAIIQMHAETLRMLDAALVRLNEGAYGQCFECGLEIAERRLRALPFVVRCRECEETREKAAHETSYRSASLR